MHFMRAEQLANDCFVVSLFFCFNIYYILSFIHNANGFAIHFDLYGCNGYSNQRIYIILENGVPAILPRIAATFSIGFHDACDLIFQ